MDWYAIIKSYYDAGCYSKDQVQVFVTANKITSEQAIDITDSAA
ncbi:XkdX family protein [Paenibacillus sp. FSL H8-0261]